MPVLDATIGGASANTYNDLAALVVIADELLPIPEAYLAADSDLQARGAIMAARLIDLEPVVGSLASSTQARQWPRSGVYGVLATVLPAPLTYAHALLTFYLVDLADQEIDPLAVEDDASVTGLSLGSEMSIQFAARTAEERQATPVEVFLDRVIRPLLANLIADPANVFAGWSSGPTSIRGPSR